MLEPDIELIEPTEALAAEFVAYAEEFREAGEPYVHGGLDRVGGDVAVFVRRCRDDAAGRNLPEGRVAGSTFWLVRGGRIIGQVRLRHSLTESLRKHGGHIGYEVRPSERRKGYASRMLAMALHKARRMGLTRLLLTCDRGNAASRRVIQKNGGVFEDEVEAEGQVNRRYWIDIGASDG